MFRRFVVNNNIQTEKTSSPADRFWGLCSACKSGCVSSSSTGSGSGSTAFNDDRRSMETRYSSTNWSCYRLVSNSLLKINRVSKPHLLRIARAFAWMKRPAISTVLSRKHELLMEALSILKVLCIRRYLKEKPSYFEHVRIPWVEQCEAQNPQTKLVHQTNCKADDGVHLVPSYGLQLY